jgi:hypothetical protein
LSIQDVVHSDDFILSRQTKLKKNIRETELFQ